MVSLLLPVIYLAFISLGLPDALLGAAWPSMYPRVHDHLRRDHRVQPGQRLAQQ